LPATSLRERLTRLGAPPRPRPQRSYELPRGFEEGHPAARWLKYRSFTAYRPLTPDEVQSPRLAAMLERDFAVLVPLVRWLNAAIGYRPWERRY